MSQRLLILALLSVLLGGCSTVGDLVGGFFEGEDNAEPPTPLTPIDGALAVSTEWRERFGNGSGGDRLSLVPAVRDEYLFVADAEGLVGRLDVATGATQWSHDTDVALAGGPGVGDALAVVGSSNAEVLALAAETGALRWRVPVSSVVLSVPVLSEGLVLIRTVDGRLTALRAEDGSKAWAVEQVVPVLSLRGVGTPVVRDGVVYAGFANGKLAAYAVSDGRKLWESSVAVPRGRSELARLVDVDSTPVIGRDVVYSTSYQGDVTAVARDTGSVLWQKEMSSYSGISLYAGVVFVADADGLVWALDADSGESLWKQDKLRARQLTGPVVHGDLVAVADLEGYVHWLSQDDGSLVARTRVGEAPVQVRPEVVDDILYVYGNGGDLAAIRLPE